MKWYNLEWYGQNQLLLIHRSTITMTSHEHHSVSNHHSFESALKNLCRPKSKKHQSLHYCLFVRGIHWWPVIPPHQRPVTWKKLPQVHLFMQEHEKRKPWWVIIPSNYQLTIIYTKCWLLLSHWDESILLSYHICIKLLSYHICIKLMSRITKVKRT